MLSLKQLENICLINDNSSAKCRYLELDEKDYEKYQCAKKNISKARIINMELNKFLGKIKENSFNVPLGDNCEGYKVSRTTKQGYDIPRILKI